MCKQQGVTGYPTFHYYRQGEFVSKYSGARSKQAFLDFFSEQQKQAAKQEEQAAKQEKQPPKQEEQPPKQPPKQEQEQKAKAKTKKEEL